MLEFVILKLWINIKKWEKMILKKIQKNFEKEYYDKLFNYQTNIFEF